MGAGSLGPVFRGADPESPEPVAIKLLQVQLTPDQARTVADALAVLVADWPAHACLAAPVGAGIADAAPYVVWPLVPGDPLDVALREYGPAAAQDAAERLVGLAEALDAAAEVGAWHGALHPRDIIVAERDTVLIGAGIVPILERVGARPPIRKPYVAPEVLAGERSSPASDQYSLAAIAYEWLFGARIPGPAEALMTVPAIPDADRTALAEAFTSALAVSPAERFADCRAFVESLVLATGGPRPKRTPKSRPRRARQDASPLPLMFGAEQDPADVVADLRNAPDADALGSHEMALGPALAAPVADWVANTEPAAFVPPTVAEPQGERSSAPTDDGPLARSHPAPAVDELEPAPAAETVRRGPVGGTPMFEASTPASSGFGMGAVVASLIVGLVLGLAAGYVLALRAWSLAPAGATRASRPVDTAARPDEGAASPSAPARGPVAEAPSTVPGRTPSSAPPSKVPAPVDERPAASASSPAAAAPGRAAAPAARPAAPDAKAAPAVTGRLLVRSVPAGAEVSVDGERRGITPLTLRDVTLGTRRVTIGREGYGTAEQRVSLTRARPSRTVDVTLRAAPAAPPPTPPPAPVAREGSLSVESRPAGARVTVDGKPVGVTPLALPGLAPGTYTVRVEMDGYEPVTAQARVVAGERARVAVSLTERF